MLAGQRMTKEQYDEYRRQKKQNERENSTDDTLFEETDELHELQKIPNSFRKLEDHHFPLFITYDKFSKMLMETYDINSKNLRKLRKNILYDDDDQNDLSDDDEYNEHFISYRVFQKRYWPSLEEYCKRKFDCGLVYSEFSIIKVYNYKYSKFSSSFHYFYFLFILKFSKGSNPDVDCLSREDYNDASIKKYPVFLYNRDLIYDLFLQYEKLKKRNGQYDSIDR